MTCMYFYGLCNYYFNPKSLFKPLTISSLSEILIKSTPYQHHRNHSIPFLAHELLLSLVETNLREHHQKICQMIPVFFY